MKALRMLTFCLLLSMMLTACGNVPTGTTEPANTTPTVGNIFTVPATTSPAADTVLPTEPTAGAADTPTETTASSLPPLGGQPLSGTLFFGPAGDPLLDDNGPYRVYAGGELELPYRISTTSEIADAGLGVLLFLDGVPQPYRTADSTEYAYMHTFYPEKGEEYIADIRFVPVTGKQGDDLELYAATIQNPADSIADDWELPSHTFGSVTSGTRLKYEATPPAQVFPEKVCRLSDVSITYVDTTYNEVGSWSEDELLEGQESYIYVNGIGKRDDENIIYEMFADKDVSLRFEVWGSPYVHYGVVFFVENEPVFPGDGSFFYAEVRSGQKTVIEATLSMAAFDGESPVYAVLVPRNYRSSEVLTSCFLDCSRTFILSDLEQPKKPK